MRTTRRATLLTTASMAVLLAACAEEARKGEDTPMETTRSKGGPPTDTAIFAGGCFWCMEPPFDKLPGVVETMPGYTGGSAETATYELVSRGATQHVEAIRVRFDPRKTTYVQLLDAFWRSIDPTDDGGQFADRGPQYEPAIYYADDEQRALAEESKKRLEVSRKFGEPIAVPIREAGPFYAAEEYHRDYYKKNAAHYHRYRSGSGRAGFLERTWGGD